MHGTRQQTGVRCAGGSPPRLAWFVALGVVALASAGGCTGTAGRAGWERERAISQTILGAEAGLDGSGLAFVGHAQGAVVCSGALIAPTLIVTAKHCVFASDASLDGGDMPLPVDGFRIGFGPGQDSLTLRGVDDLQWVGMPTALSAADAVTSGEDVAVLHLTEPAPPGEKVRDVALVFSPADSQPVRVGGFGVTDVVTGSSGTRGIGDGRVAGYDTATGIIEIQGGGVCFGDSGGPVLSADGETIVAVLSEIGGGDGGFCQAGIAFADTAANAGVQRLLAKACAGVGGCGPDAGGLVSNAAADADEETDVTASQDSPASESVDDEAGSRAADGGNPPNDDAPGEGSSSERHAAGNAGCSLANRGGRLPSDALAIFAWAAAFLVRLARRRDLRPRGVTSSAASSARA